MVLTGQSMVITKMSNVGKRLLWIHIPDANGSTVLEDLPTQLGHYRGKCRYLVGGLEHDFYFPIELGIIIPMDFHIFQRD